MVDLAALDHICIARLVSAGPQGSKLPVIRLGSPMGTYNLGAGETRMVASGNRGPFSPDCWPGHPLGDQRFECLIIRVVQLDQL